MSSGLSDFELERRVRYVRCTSSSVKRVILDHFSITDWPARKTVHPGKEKRLLRRHG